MREHRQSFVMFVLVVGFAGCSSGGSDPNAQTSNALTGCVIGADCNVKGMVCNVDPKDPKSPFLFCDIPPGSTSGTYQSKCREGSFCKTPGGTCYSKWTDPLDGTDEWFICTTGNKLVPMSIPDTSTDTGPADTGTLDTGTSDTGAPDTGSPDTGTADTGTLDTGVVDTGAPDSGADTSVADSGSDTGLADTGTGDATVDSGDAGLVCVAPPSILDCKPNLYGCKNPDIGAFCTDTSSSPPSILFCKCGDGAGLGWLLPWGTACSSVPVCVAKCDGGTCTDSGSDATTDTTVADTTVADSSDGSSADSASDTTDGTTSDTTTVADSSSDSSADAGTDATPDGVADTTDTGPCIADSGIDASTSNYMFRWVPPAGYVQTGAVNLVGATSDGSVVNWGTTPGTGIVTLVSDGCGAYVGSVSLPSGITFEGNVKHADVSLSPDGVGWVFDASSKAGGGCFGKTACCGQNFGTFTLTKAGVAVPFTRISNLRFGTGADATCPVTAPDLSRSNPDGGTTNGEVYFNIQFST